MYFFTQLSEVFNTKYLSMVWSCWCSTHTINMLMGHSEPQKHQRIDSIRNVKQNLNFIDFVTCCCNPFQNHSQNYRRLILCFCYLCPQTSWRDQGSWIRAHFKSVLKTHLCKACHVRSNSVMDILSLVCFFFCCACRGAFKGWAEHHH